MKTNKRLRYCRVYQTSETYLFNIGNRYALTVIEKYSLFKEAGICYENISIPDLLHYSS